MKFHLYTSGSGNGTVAHHSGYVSCVAWISCDLVATCGDDRRLIFWNAQMDPVKSVPLPMSSDTFPTSMHYPPMSSGSGAGNGGGGQGSGHPITESTIFLTNVKLDSQWYHPLAIGATNGSYWMLPINWSPTSNGSSSAGGLGGPKSGTGASGGEKSFPAHKGAIIVIRWSNDNSTLATAGEDGLVKIWSRQGMLRSTVQTSPAPALPVYALAWSPDSNALVYVNHANLVIKSLTPQSKTLEWMAHDGLVISVHWSPVTNRILSASEDGRVKVWDPSGRTLYVSSRHQSALTSVAWSTNGQLFAVATFNSLELHDQYGHCLSVEKLTMEGLASVAWSPDSNQVAVTCSSGRVLFAYVVDRRAEWKIWLATTGTRRTIKIANTVTDFRDMLEFKDPVHQFALAFDHLVVVTRHQCFVYHVENLATPHYFDLKNFDPGLIRQSPRYFLLVSGTGQANLYSYDGGRFLRTIKLSNNFRPESLRDNLMALNDQTLVYRDPIHHQCIHLIQLDRPHQQQQQQSQLPHAGPEAYRHQLEVVTVTISCAARRTGSGGPAISSSSSSTSSPAPWPQLAAILDRNSDLYILSWSGAGTGSRTGTRTPVSSLRVFKLSSMIRDIAWHTDHDLLAALHENRTVSIWLYPNAAFLDSALLPDVTLAMTNPEVSSNGRVVSFSQNRVTLERVDHVRVHLTVNPFVILLHKHRADQRLDEAVRMCNFLDQSIQEVEPVERNVRDALWATLAVMALEARQFRIAEVAYAAINKLDKVLYLNRIKTLPAPDLAAAELELLCGNIDVGEHLLLQKGFIVRAVQLNLQRQQWPRAMELALAYNPRFSGITITGGGGDGSPIKVDLIHMVLSCRENHLRQRNRQETLGQFVNFFNEIDQLVPWPQIERMLARDDVLCNRINDPTNGYGRGG